MIVTNANDYFASVFTIDNGVLPVFHPKDSCVQAYQQVEFTHSKVLCALKRLPSKYSRTLDGFLLDFKNQLLLPLPFHCPGFLQCLWTAGVYLRVGNRQLFVPSSKKVPVNHLAIIVRFLLPVFVAK